MKTQRLPALVIATLVALTGMRSAAGPESDSFRAFGPVIERKLKPCVSPDFPALNLGAGFMLRLDYAPPEPLSCAYPEMREWRETSGADLVIRRSPDGSGYHLRAYMRVCRISNKFWEEELEKNVETKFPEGDEDAHELAFSSTAEPVTYAFRTRRDACGMLQLLGSGPDANGVRIRYKLSRFVNRPEDAALQQVRKRISGSSVGSKEWLEAQFDLANWSPKPYPDETFKIIEEIKAHAHGDSLVLAKVESALVSYYRSNHEMDVAERHCRTLIDYVLKELNPDSSRPSIDDSRRMDLTGELLHAATWSRMLAATFEVPVVQRIRRITSFSSDYGGLQAVQRNSEDALFGLGALTTSLWHPSNQPTPMSSGTLILNPAPDGDTKNQKDDAIDRLVARLAATRGLWRNGIFLNLKLPQTASTEQIVEQVFKITNLDKGHVKDFKILQSRSVRIDGESYTAAEVQTDLGKKVVLFTAGGAWNRVYDADEPTKTGPPAAPAPESGKAGEAPAGQDGTDVNKRPALTTEVIAEKQTVELGEPILVSVRVTSQSVAAVELSGSALQFEHFKVDIAPDGGGKQTYVPYVGFEGQIRERRIVIPPHSTMMITEALDLNDHYLFTRPGRCTVSFYGKFGDLPDSPPITIEIAPGRVSDMNEAVASVLQLIPEGVWDLVKGERESVAPAGWSRAPGFSLRLVHNLVKEDGAIWLWFTKEEAKVDANPSPLGRARHLGLWKARGYHVYELWSGDAGVRWPLGHRKDIAGAFVGAPPQGQAAPFTVKILLSGSLQVDGHDVTDEDLLARLKTFAEESPDQEVLLTIDMDTKDVHRIRAMRLCNKAGLENYEFGLDESGKSKLNVETATKSKPEESPLKSTQLPDDDGPQTLAAAAKMGAETAAADIKAGTFRILEYGEPRQITKDPQTGFRIQPIAGCKVTKTLIAEADAYNQAMRDWHAKNPQNGPQP